MMVDYFQAERIFLIFFFKLYPDISLLNIFLIFQFVSSIFFYFTSDIEISINEIIIIIIIIIE